MKLNKSATVFAALAVALQLATAVAAPASADSASDEQFLQALKVKGIDIGDGKAVSLAHSTCSSLKQGGTFNSALKHVAESSGLPGSEASTFTSYSIYVYCRNYMPKKNG